jgi:hypothetical protein
MPPLSRKTLAVWAIARSQSSIVTEMTSAWEMLDGMSQQSPRSKVEALPVKVAIPAISSPDPDEARQPPERVGKWCSGIILIRLTQ